MDPNPEKKRLAILLGGDIVTLGLVTIVGFATHGTLGTAGLRMFTTFIPAVLAWLLAAPFLGVYDVQRAADYRQLWRPVWAMALAGPLATWLRGVALGNAPIPPVFVAVLSGVSAMALLAWRGIYILLFGRKK
jgi:hypothetical protein